MVIRMKNSILLRANMKSQKSSFIGILALMFIITISLLAVLSIWINANDYENEQIDRLGYGDITYWIETVDIEPLLSEVNAVAEVEKSWAQDVVIFEEYDVYGKEEKEPSIIGSLHMMTWTMESGYSIYNDSLTEISGEPPKLASGEIYVSPSFSSLYRADIGDQVGIRVSEDGEMLFFTIKGYFEDPIAGSALMGMKRALLTESDMRKIQGLVEEAGEKARARNGSVVHIYQREDSELALAGLQKRLGEETHLLEVSGFSYPKATIIGFMLILQNIFAGFLLVFMLVLMVVAMIIIGHSISSSIEQDYVDMGILKALGYTRKDLRIVQMLQYLAAILCGILPGIPVSVLVVRLVDSMTVTVVGLLIPADIPVGVSLLALGMIVLVIMGFVYVKTAKIGKITPIRAIRGGAEDVYFASRLTAPVRKCGLSFWLAYRQLVSGKRQYRSASLVAALLVFFLSLTVRMEAWLGPDGSGLMESFAAARFDYGIRYEEEGIREEIEEMLASQAPIADTYQFKMSRGFLNQTEFLMNIISEPAYYNILEGRTCLYANELVMTQTVADELGVAVGDMVSLGCNGKEQEFIISGIYQCANDMGSNFGVTKEGYESFGMEEEAKMPYYIFYVLEDATDMSETLTMIKEAYDGKVTVDDNTWSGVDAILLATSALMSLLLIITIVFILVTVSLTGSKILYKEQHDMGIYKSLGFLSSKLRIAFAIRFGITAVAGSVLGMVLSVYLTDPLADLVLKVCGVSHFTSRLGPLDMLMPALAVCALFFGFAYLSSGKVKKVEPGILIVE